VEGCDVMRCNAMQCNAMQRLFCWLIFSYLSLFSLRCNTMQCHARRYLISGVIPPPIDAHAGRALDELCPQLASTPGASSAFCIGNT
jgi:hypothetical protein